MATTQYRNGNNYRVLIKKETTSGEFPATAWTDVGTTARLLPDTIEMSPETTQIETGVKTQTGLATPCELRGGYKKHTVTLTGMLSNEHDILLQAATPDTASPYVVDALPTLKSYSILRIWHEDVSTPYTVDAALGCQLKSFKITGASGGMIQYEAVFMAKSIDRENSADYAITGTDPGTPCTKGFNFGDMTASTELCFGDTEHLKSFELTIDYELADDATSFQNSNTRLETLPLRANCTLNYVTNYDALNTAYDAIAESKLYDTTALEEVIVLQLTTGTTQYDWVITTHGQLTDYTLADPGKALFENNVTEKLCYYNTPAYPVTITVNTVTG